MGAKNAALLVGLLCCAYCAGVAATAIGTADDAKKCPAKLLKHAALPSETFAILPADVPDGLQISGAYDNSKNRRNLTLGSVDKGTSVKLPVKGQPVQGFSGIKALKDGAGKYTGQFIVLTDNGYGTKANSPDSLLMFHYVTPNFDNKTVAVNKTVFIRDPNKVITFPIINENTKERYLTGADLDLESIQNVDDSFFIGEEFGPYLIETDRDGVVKSFYDASSKGVPLVSPDNLLIRLPGTPSDLTSISFNVRRSKGFEGMAASSDGKYLYPLLEGALYDKNASDLENINGTYYLRMMKFNVANKTFDANFSAKYPLANKTNSIGDFNLIDDRHGLVIERDDGEGDSRASCAVANVTGCFKTPAAFKRVYLVDLSDLDANGFVKKLAYVDLLDIQDPNNVAISGTINGTFKFPFFTVEGVDAVGPSSIIVENDNNFPSSSTRVPGKNDNNEFIILDVGNFLSGSC